MSIPIPGSVNAQYKERLRLINTGNIHIFKIKHFPGYVASKLVPFEKQDPYFKQKLRMYKYLKDGHYGKAAKSIVSDDNISYQFPLNCDTFRNLHPLHNVIPPIYSAPLNHNNSLSCTPLTYNQLIKSISRLDTSKAPGIDCFSNKLIKSLIFKGSIKQPTSSGILLTEAMLWCINNVFSFPGCHIEVINYFHSDLCALISQSGK